MRKIQNSGLSCAFRRLLYGWWQQSGCKFALNSICWTTCKSDNTSHRSRAHWFWRSQLIHLNTPFEFDAKTLSKSSIRLQCSMWTSVTTSMRSFKAIVRTRLWFEDCLLVAEAHTPSSWTTSPLLEIGTAPGQSMRGSPVSACRSRVGAFLPFSPVLFFLCKTRKRNTIIIKSNFRLSFCHPRQKTLRLSPSDYVVYSVFSSDACRHCALLTVCTGPTTLRGLTNNESTTSCPEQVRTLAVTFSRYK